MPKKDELAKYLFHQGTNYKAYEYLGAHFVKRGKKEGVVFRVWSPSAKSVSVVGDFNGWDKSANPMINDDGVFETFVEGLKMYDNYKFCVVSDKGEVLKQHPRYTTSTGISGTTANTLPKERRKTRIRFR